MGALATAILDRFTPAVARAKLTAMAAMFNHRPSLRHHLRCVHPTGTEIAFTATIQFVTWDGAAGVHAIFRDGKMHARSGPAKSPDTTVRFRSPEQMRAFFAGANTFHMLLDNTLRLEGNLSYVFKFGHLAVALARGNQRLDSASPKHGWPQDWRDLEAPPVGEPCRERPAGEVTHLDDPHLASYSLDDFPSLKRLLWTARTRRPEICAERPRLLTEFMLRARANGAANDAPVLRQAKAIQHLLSQRTAIVNDDDLLAGTTTSKRVGIVIFPELGGVGIWPELLTVPGRDLNPYDISAEDVETLNREVFPFWTEDNLRDWAKDHAEDRLPLELDERFVLYFLWKTQALSHTAIDLPRVLDRGLLDIQAEARERRSRADTPEQQAFYEALDIALQGVVDYAEHLADEAARQLEVADAEVGARRQALADMQRICRKVPANPPETLHEAIQAIVILFLSLHQENMGAGLVVGRLDAWLEPFFQRELEGVTDPAEKQRVVERTIELCGALMLKLTDHLPMVPDVGNRLFGGSSENQVITLGGQTADGATAVSDMTWIFLKATEMLNLRDPNMNARYAPGVNSEAYLRRLCEVNLLTHATPSLHNDDAVVAALEAQGFSTEHARDWTATGCVEPTSCGRHFGHTNCMMLNLVAPLEMALNDGHHPVLNDQVGPHTGPVEALTTFEAFFAAYTEQLGWLIDRAVEANNTLGRAHQILKPTPLMSALFDGPMEAGRDVTQGGARYNTSGAALVGLTDVIDSLCAIKTLVYERGVVSLKDLVAALADDFEGHDVLRARVLKTVPKFGEEHALPRAIARDLQAFAFERYQAQEHYRGGKYLPGYWSMSNHVAFGLLSGALPSGRRKGRPFTPGLTPSHRGRSSLTDQLRTVAALDAVHMPNNIAFNVKVVPGAGDSHQAVVHRMAAYAASYFELGGMQMQFNVTSTETLREAMEHPEEHGDLLVRISGYNAYFVELNRDIQLELIERVEHSLGG